MCLQFGKVRIFRMTAHFVCPQLRNRTSSAPSSSLASFWPTTWRWSRLDCICTSQPSSAPLRHHPHHHCQATASGIRYAISVTANSSSSDARRTRRSIIRNTTTNINNVTTTTTTTKTPPCTSPLAVRCRRTTPHAWRRSTAARCRRPDAVERWRST